MPRITVCHPDGLIETIDATAGPSLLDALRLADVAGIGGFCGGICACICCMVRIDPAWIDRAGPPTAAEDGMRGLMGDPSPGDRLACQIRVDAALDGLVVHTVPPA